MVRAATKIAVLWKLFLKQHHSNSEQPPQKNGAIAEKIMKATFRQQKIIL